MELLITLTRFEDIHHFKDYGIKGVIAGSHYFSSRFRYTLDELKKISIECMVYDLDFFVSLDTMIEEEDRNLLREYLEFIIKLKPKGIFFSDLAIYEILKNLDYDFELHFDPQTLITNSLDASFFISKGMDVVAAKEITIEETLKIAHMNKDHVSMQIFGYLKNAISKRPFLTNYFKHQNLNVDLKNKLNVTIVEETRDYRMPILETDYGTNIYTDYCLISFLEYHLMTDLKYGIIDDLFVDKKILYDVLNTYRLLNLENAKFLETSFILKYPDIRFDKGYFYQKTSIKKEDD